MLSRVGRRGFAVAIDAKEVVHGQRARLQILQGANTLADAVGATLGPRGRNVVLQQAYGGPKITKDGVTVARNVELKDPLANLGATLIKQVAQSTNDSTGDGTTTATILARDIFRAGCEAVAAGLNPVDVLRGMQKASDAITRFLETVTKRVVSDEDLYHVARVSANGDQAIGRLIADAIRKVGRDGTVTVAEGKTTAHSVSYTEGYELDRGYNSPYFVTEPKGMQCLFSDAPAVLLSEDRISSLKNILQVLEQCAQNGKELLIVADDFDQDVLTTLILNRLRGGLKVCAVKAPGFGDFRKQILDDLACLTSATVLSKDRGVTTATVAHLGNAQKIVASKDRCLIMGGTSDKKKLATQIEQLKRFIADDRTSEYEREKYQERVAKLTGGVAVIHIGGNSEVEIAETKDRVEDALNATKAALKEGVLPGGGSGLLFAAESIKDLKGDNMDQTTGIGIIRRACQAPIRQIASNAGFEGALVIGNLLKDHKFGYGFDAVKGEYVDMLKAGILDPALVVKTALRDATSVASLMCTTEAAVYSLPTNENRGVPGSNDM